MARESISSLWGTASSKPEVVDFAMDRLKQEHERLRQQLKTLENSAKEVCLLNDPARGVQALQDLSRQTSELVEVLESHAKWEDQELFPFLLNYFHSPSVPTITPSFWVLEKDHQLALLFIQTFHEAVIAVTPLAEKKQLAEAADTLIQACLILNDHFTMEEQIVFSFTEKILTDLDYFFS